MRLIQYLTFDGTCEEAMTFYAGVLGGEIAVLQRFGEMPDTSWVPEGMANRVAHARLVFGDQFLMASDNGGQAPFHGHHGFSLSMNCDSVADGDTLFGKLSEGGTVDMPFQETFWAKGFGMCHDRFGVPWMINVEGE